MNDGKEKFVRGIFHPEKQSRHARTTAPSSSHVVRLGPMPSGRVEDFCFRLFFSVLLITFDFFICLSGAGTDGICFGSSEGSESARNKIFAENTLCPKGVRKIFRKTNSSARSCKSVDSGNTFAADNRSIRHRSAQTEQNEEKVIEEKCREKIVS